LVKKHLGAEDVALLVKKESPYSAAVAAAESPRSQQQMRDIATTDDMGMGEVRTRDAAVAERAGTQANHRGQLTSLSENSSLVTFALRAGAS
jgi:hypothetical protein